MSPEPSKNLQNLSGMDVVDEFFTFEELGMYSEDALATAATSVHGNHSKSDNGDEIPIADEQCISYLNDNGFDQQLEEFENIYKEYHNNAVNMQSNVSVEAEFNTLQQQLSLSNVSVEAEFNTLQQQLSLDGLLPHQQPLQNDGVENQSSHVPYLNLENNENEIPKGQQQVPSYEGEIATSTAMNEMNHYSTRKKRKKSKEENGNKSIIRCNCKKSKCLQRYCECFSMGLYCTDECGCTDCYNREIYEDTVWAAKHRVPSKSASAFAPQNVQANETSSSSARPIQGCKCKQSMCQKNYCECFQAGVSCTVACRCDNCHNPSGIRADRDACSSGNSNNNIAQENTNTSNTTTTDAWRLSLTRSTTLSTSINNERHATPDTSSTSNLTNAGTGHSPSDFLSPDVNYLYELLFCNNETPSRQPLGGVRAENGVMLHNNNPNPTSPFVATPTNNHPPMPFPPYPNYTSLEAPRLASFNPSAPSTSYIKMD